MPHNLTLPDDKARFLEALLEKGTVRRAFLTTKLKPADVFRWQDEDPEFAEAWRMTERVTASWLEDAAFKRAVEGTQKPLYYQGVPIYQYQTLVDDDGRPVKDENGRDVVEIVRDENGQPIQAAERQYSDTLLTLLLRAHDPKYREKTGVELSGPGGKPLYAEASPLEIARRIMYTVQRGLIEAKNRQQLPGDVVDAEYAASDDPGGDLV